MNSYILCATPRSGSTLLCEMLRETGRAGAPDSFLMEDLAPVWQEAWGFPDPAGLEPGAFARAMLSATLKAGRGGTPVFGLRLMWKTLPRLVGLIKAIHPAAAPDKARIERVFGRTLFIHLTRADRLAQAVSLVKAEQSGLWHITSAGDEMERVAPPKEPHYDAARITEVLADLATADAGWQGWFDAQGITPVVIAYEDLSADPGKGLDAIFAALGLAPLLGPPRPATGKMSDPINADWIARFRLETDHQDQAFAAAAKPSSKHIVHSSG